MVGGAGEIKGGGVIKWPSWVTKPAAEKGESSQQPDELDALLASYSRPPHRKSGEIGNIPVEELGGEMGTSAPSFGHVRYNHDPRSGEMVQIPLPKQPEETPLQRGASDPITLSDPELSEIASGSIKNLRIILSLLKQGNGNSLFFRDSEGVEWVISWSANKNDIIAFQRNRAGAPILEGVEIGSIAGIFNGAIAKALQDCAGKMLGDDFPLLQEGQLSLSHLDANPRVVYTYADTNARPTIARNLPHSAEPDAAAKIDQLLAQATPSRQVPTGTLGTH